MEQKKRVILAAGGSGGHVMPAIAVAEALREADKVEVMFLGTGRQMERDLVEGQGFKYFSAAALPITGQGLRGILRFSANLPRLLFGVSKVYRRVRPALVMGFGGYPSFCPLLMAWLSRVPCILHEQNVQVGLANKISALFVGKVFAVSGGRGFFWKSKVQQVSNPVRAVFEKCQAWRPWSAGEAPRLLVIGGSQGALSINSAMIKLLNEKKLLDCEILHQAGARDYQRVSDAYAEMGLGNVKVLDFIENMAKALDGVHLVISRAGALSVAELSAAGRPAIFVPLDIAGAHQHRNVEHLLREGLCRVVEHGEGFEEALFDQISRLIAEPESLASMAQGLRDRGQKMGLSSQKFLAEQIHQLSGVS